MTHATHRYEPRQGYLDNAKAEAFVTLYRRTFAEIRAESDLSPENRQAYARINALMAAVREQYSEDDLKQILADRQVRQLRMSMCQQIARAERDAAFFWSSRLERADFHNFTLFRNYDRQADNELAVFPIRRFPMKDKHRILMVGSGPLPIDAILMHQKTDKKITCIDADKAVVDAGRDFLSRMGYDSRTIRYIHASDKMYGYEDHPIAIINNCDSNNFAILSNIVEIRYSENIWIRSGAGLSATVYESFSQELATYLKLVMSPKVAAGTLETMQTTIFATLIMAPESRAKPGMGAGREGYAFALNRLQEDMMKPENRYLLPNHPSWVN